MTTEQIAAIKAAQKSRTDFLGTLAAELRRYDNVTLKPLLEVCDHTYPWGENAIDPSARNYDMGELRRCRICGMPVKEGSEIA